MKLTYIFESPDNGKTIFRRIFSEKERKLIRANGIDTDKLTIENTKQLNKNSYISNNILKLLNKKNIIF